MTAIPCLTHQRLEQLLAAFPQRRIALIGDLFLDRYLELLDVHELSIETGLEAFQVASIRNAPGALGTVMNNLAALGVGWLIPVTVIGDDGHGYDLRRSLNAMPVDDTYLLSDPERMTPTYTKPLRPVGAGVWTELNRLDVRTRAPLSPATCERLRASLRQAWAECEGMIVMDQVAEPGCGVVNDEIRAELMELAAADPGKLLIADSRGCLHRFERGALKGNRAEIVRADAALAGAAPPSPAEDPSDDDLSAALERFRALGRSVFCTDGERGIHVVTGLASDGSNEPIRLAPGRRVDGPVDIVGAGDTVTAALTAALLSGADPLEAAALANLAASISVQKLGETGVATPAELRESWIPVEPTISNLSQK
ncbi:MAG: carbohydrate kinase [Planctomycetales bacterium]|nr:carbohydrate kinase [Planctomycetales bacterium]